MPRFSVIIPVYNRPAFVRETLESVLPQTFSDREIIVVDDASTDVTPAVLRSFGDSIRVITLAQQQGCEGAYNAGVAVARGTYLAFLDSDDVMFRDTLETYDFVITALGQPPLVVSRIVYFKATPPQLVRDVDRCPVEVVKFDDYLARDRSMGSTLSMIVVRRDAFHRVGGFRRSTTATFNMSIHDFLLRVGCEGPAILVERPHLVAYRVHSGSCNWNNRRAVDGMLRVIRTERQGGYPGGRARRFDRVAFIGGPTLHWSRTVLRRGSPLLAAWLLLAGSDMILAKVLRILRNKFRRPVPTLRLARARALLPPVA